MRDIILPRNFEVEELGSGCAYLIEGSDGRVACGAPRRFALLSAPSFALLHSACGSKAEARRIREVETLASAVGGRRARQGALPSRQFLERLEQAIRDVS
jgi:hypothetical protein